MATEYLQSAAKLAELAGRVESRENSLEPLTKDPQENRALVPSSLVSERAPVLSDTSVHSIDEILHSQNLLKQSKHLKQWRKRWTVLSRHGISTYKKETQLSEPTMAIHIDALKKVESSDHFTGKRHTFDILVQTSGNGPDEVFSFKCDNREDKRRWIREIEQAKLQRQKEQERDLHPVAPCVQCCSVL